MKYIFFTYEGLAFPIAQHLLSEGHDVQVAQAMDDYFTRTKSEKEYYEKEEEIWKNRRLLIYKNIIDRVTAEEMVIKMKTIKNPSDYFVFFDSNNLFHYADQVKDLGFNGNFPTEQDRLFEIDRDFAKEFVKKYYPKIKIANKIEFKSVNAAQMFFKNKGSHSAWVFKGKRDEFPAFVPVTDNIEIANEQVLETISLYKSYYQHDTFFLEEKIPNVMEITPEKYYYDGEAISMMINIENKHIGSQNLSTQTGCAQDLVFPLSMDNPIHDVAFPPIVDELAKKHKGLFMWDASLLINSKTGEIYFGEFCPNRVWFNSTFTALAQLPNINYFFETILKKKNPFKFGTVSASARLFNLQQNSIDRYILSDLSVDFPQKNEKNIWPLDVYKLNKKDKLRTVGYMWDLAIVTGSSNTIKKAVDALYATVETISMAQVYYRPKFDYLSLDYSTAILNRLNYGVKSKLFKLPFNN